MRLVFDESCFLLDRAVDENNKDLEDVYHQSQLQTGGKAFPFVQEKHLRRPSVDQFWSICGEEILFK